MALFDAFLKLDGIKGESPDSQHKDEIDVMSFSWGEEQTAGSPTSGGSGAAKVKFHDFSITKKTDASSPLLMLHCELPSEQVTLSFAKVEVSYQLQGPDGKAQGGPIVAGWDVKANKAQCSRLSAKT